MVVEMEKLAVDKGEMFGTLLTYLSKVFASLSQKLVTAKKCLWIQHASIKTSA